MGVCFTAPTIFWDTLLNTALLRAWFLPESSLRDFFSHILLEFHMHCLNSGGSRLQLAVVHERTLVLTNHPIIPAGRLQFACTHS
jgi:hypothetical protein